VKVQLVGGSHDGESVEVSFRRSLIHILKPISVAKMIDLQIDDSVMWRPPQEVYELGKDGLYYYIGTNHYKPKSRKEWKNNAQSKDA